jgi:prophage maintenance system killer protein
VSAVPDEAGVLWAAALVEGVDPARLLTSVDVTALSVAVAEAAAERDPVDVAAVLLVELVRRRPFPASNAAIAWLATVDLLAASSIRLVVEPDEAVELCRAIGGGAAGRAEVAAAVRGRVVEVGLVCPVCGRRVHAGTDALDELARRLVPPGGTAFELTARCAFEHGVHDRSGRPVAAVAARAGDARQPVLARGACGSFLVAGEGGSVAVSPYCDDPPLVRVVEVDEVHPGDLVGRWDPLVRRSTPLGVVPADEAAPDEQGCVDLDRLRRALRAGGRRPVGATGPGRARRGEGAS